MNTAQELRSLLQKIDHRGYPAYKDTRGSYDFGSYVLSIDHVQGDPFASPSDVSIHVKKEKAGFPAELWDTPETRIALQDFLLRLFGRRLLSADRTAHGSGKSGRIFITRCGQEILDRTACQIDSRTGELTVRFQLGFPANGRTINSGELIKVLFEALPPCVKECLFYPTYPLKQKEQTMRVAGLAREQKALRQLLAEKGLVAFLADGAVLPRESGSCDRPMKDAVPFRSPDSLRVTMELPDGKKITGMGIRRGITLIVGGGYHGKSTLLDALERGVYNHIQGDGREYVVCDASALKSRAEDGRAIHNVDISFFIRQLPSGKKTTCFTTEDASGSTSQAAGIVEGLASGARVLLIDEDTSATNFMIRDELMQRVVHKEEEPIIPFIDRVQELYEKKQVSTILVAGSSGSYFQVADTVIQMKEYRPVDITEMAKREAVAFNAERSGRLREETEKAGNVAGKAEARDAGKTDILNWKKRIPLKNQDFTNPRLKIRTQGMNSISIDHEEIDLRLVEQLVDEEQLNALGEILKYAQLQLMDGKRDMEAVLDRIEQLLDEKGLTGIGTRGMARPRRLEIAACLNRYRSQRFQNFD